MCKTKVAPIKQESLPRLELCGDLLLAKLLSYVSRLLDSYPTKVFAWTASEIVLAWLSDIPRRWKAFVGNRTSEILTKVSRQYWHYIPSKQNPADCASRGLFPEDLAGFKLWWSGSELLRLPESTWPAMNPIPPEVPEERKLDVTCAATNVEKFRCTILFATIFKFRMVQTHLGICS